MDAAELRKALDDARDTVRDITGIDRLQQDRSRSTAAQMFIEAQNRAAGQAITEKKPRQP